MHSTADPAPPLLETRNLTIDVGHGASRRTLAANVTLQATRGRFVCLLGPNGAGKSTLLKTLAGLHPPATGEILLAGKPALRYTNPELAKLRAWCGPLRHTPPEMTVAELVALGRYPHTDAFGRLQAADTVAIAEALEAVQLSEFAARTVASLSDGERQKAQVARLLAQRAQLLLLDEPTAFLDAKRRVELLILLRDLAHRTPCAIVAATHEIELARQYADEFWVLPTGGPVAIARTDSIALAEVLERYFR